MKNKFSIRINGNDAEMLSVSLHDILALIDEGPILKWSVLWIHGTGDLGVNKNMLDFEDQVKNSSLGVFYTWDELVALSKKFKQLIELVLIGASSVRTLKRYDDDNIMHSLCQYTIELIDSSYWEIHSLNIDTLQKMEDELAGVEFIKE